MARDIDRLISNSLLRILFQQLEIEDTFRDSGANWIARIRVIVMASALACVGIVFALVGAVLWLSEHLGASAGMGFIAASGALISAGAILWILRYRDAGRQIQMGQGA